ncbi:unnamed protein product [Brassica rapa subsp. narinosa]
MKHGADLANLSNKELLSSNYSLLFLVEMLKLCVLPHGFPFLEPNRNLSAPISLDCFIFQSRSSSLPLQKGHDVNEADLRVSPLYTCRHIFHY